MQGQRYLNRVSLLLILMIILKSLFIIFRSVRVCASFGGERGEGEKKKKRKLENLKIKKKFDLQKVKNRKRREKKSRLVVKLVQYQSFPSK
jgi:hypothetical protein